MNDLEQRLRDSLQARANDVEATPYLWDDVQRRVQRRTLQTVLLWAGGAAAAAVLAFAVVIPSFLDDTNDDVVVDPLPSETATTDPGPDQTPQPEQPTGPAEPTNLVVAADRRIDLTDLAGDPLANLVNYDSPEFEGQILSVATSPTASEGVLGVAFTVVVEGNVELRVVRADNNAELVDTTHEAWQGILPPQPVWSPDGSRLAWIDTTDGQAELKTVTWSPGPTGGELGEPVSLGTVDPLGEFQLQEWYAADRIGAIREDLREATLVVGDGGVSIGDLTSDSTVIDVARTVTGTYHLLVDAPDVPEEQGDAESATARLLYTAQGADAEPVALPLPAPFTQGTASPYGMWLDAYGETVVVGWGGLAWLGSVESGFSQLPGQVQAADLVVTGEGRGEQPRAPSTEQPGEDSGAFDVGSVGPALVLTEDRLTLETPDGGQRIILDWADDFEFKPARTELRPGSTVDDLVAVVQWVGEGETELGWVEIQDGELLEYRSFPSGYQMGGPLDGGSVMVPIWSPDGGYLAWVEEGTDGNGNSTGFGLRIIGWDGGPGTDDDASDNTSFGLEGFRDYDDVVLDQWVWNSDSDGMLTFRATADDAHDYLTVPVERQPDGAIAMPPDATVTTTTSVDEALTDVAVYRLNAHDGFFLTIQQPGSDAQHALPSGFRGDLVVELPPAAGPYLDVAGDGALLLSPDQTAWYVTVDGTFSPIGGRIRDLDAVD